MMDSTRDYVEAMALSVREHQREMGAMAKATEGRRNRLLSLRRLEESLINQPAQMTVFDALRALHACASPEWWAAQARQMRNARKDGRWRDHLS